MDLIDIASMTNQELFTKVIAAIKRSFKQKKGDKKDWQQFAIKVATRVARGDDGYRCPDDWVKQFHALSSSSSDQGASGGSSFGEALKALPARDCYRKRLDNAFTSLAAAAAVTSARPADNISVRQAAGLIRGSTFLTSTADDDGDDASNIDCELQARAISHLVQTMPQLVSNPCDIFLAVQLPLLQKLEWDAFIKGGIKFASTDAEAEFRSLLNLNFDEKCKTTTVHAGEKRKRLPGNNSDDSNKEEFSTMMHLLEAAHLARNGAVRAQHGAVIYVPSENNGGAKSNVIGRGWNHDYLLDRSKSNKNKLVLHSEVHAVADAIRNHGEDECFGDLFPKATIMIVELESDYAYDTCHPCPKCDPLLRAVGITNVQHSTPHGKIKELDLSPPVLDFLSNENVSIPLSAACDEQNICCKRLQQAASDM
ncbi:hypothetical protein ACHAXR_001574 [Thalassiosira sp. AJA248-18]